MKNRIRQGLLKGLQGDTFICDVSPIVHIFSWVSLTGGPFASESWDVVYVSQGVFTDTYIFFRDNVNTRTRIAEAMKNTGASTETS